MSSADIAVVGLAGRFPGAPDVDALWRNLRAGVESVTFYDDETLRAAGIPDDVLADPRYVKAGSVLDGVGDFDAAFFGYNAREAAVLDPQHRIFLEVAWHALEDAGHTAAGFDGSIGVYAGGALSTYLLGNLLGGRLIGSIAETLELLVTNDKDYLANRVAYKLDLGGPALAVQTACSSSLVAVHVACRALLDGECDMALAGGVAVRLPQPTGYRWEEGLIFSPDGHCRPFDADGAGTIFGSGAGVVVLRRLDDALADGDRVEAVIRGSAVTNDGAAKVGYTAPGVDGQVRVVATALGLAGVEPDTVTAVEAHGTATPLGDPIEVTALTKAFASRTGRTGYCALGSVKSNVGHLDTAAGVTGLIKAILQLRHRELVPSLHYRRPNPQIDFASTPFRVNTELRDWEVDGIPRRIGVSSFGMGGTNAHVVLEEAPRPAPVPPPAADRPAVTLLPLSARTPAALEEAAGRLAGALAGRNGAGPALADVAYTLQAGRVAFRHRQVVLCRDDDPSAAVAALTGADPERVAGGTAAESAEPVWLFPGQGSQHPGMGRELYAAEAVFRDTVDACADALAPELDVDLRRLLFPPAGADLDAAAARLERTEYAQPALFTVEYALARLLDAWGLAPAAMLGHSIGELVAACVAGVFPLPDALRLVAARGRLMQRMPPGTMLSVAVGEAELARLLPAEVSLAAVNAPDLCVVSGPEPAITELEQMLSQLYVLCRRLHTSHAFHSAAMDPMLAPFAEVVASVRLSPPTVPFVSNRTGTWITDRQATDPDYWVGQVRDPVRFGAGVRAVTAERSAVLLEVGPGRTLTTLVRQVDRDLVAVAALPPVTGGQPEREALAAALGRLWTCGVDVDLATVTGTGGRRVSLPGYPFQRRRYWIEPRRDGSATVGALTGPATGEEQDEAAPAAAGAGVDERPALSVPYVEPRDDRERRIAAIWSDLLGVAPVGVHDPFLELGGHSLLATRVVDRIRAAFRTRVPVRRILETPTVAGLAAVVAEVEESLGLADGADELPKAEPDPAGRHEPFPLAEIQQAQWLGRLGSLEGGNTAAHVYWEVDAADVDLARLEDAWQRVLDRHPMLRAVVTPDGRQRILPDVGRYRIEVLDLRAASPEEAEGRLAELREALSHEMRPADAWPLFDLRATLLPGGSTRLHLGVDLLIADIGSIRLLVADWGRFYRDPGARPDPVGLSYRDYVLAVERLRGTPLHQRSLDYWRQRIAELPPRPDLPLAAAPATVTEPEFVAREVVVGTEEWRRIVARAAAHGLTPSAVILAVYATTLGRWCRSGRFTVNVTVTNRLQVHPDVGRLVGEFASFDLLPVDLAGTGGVLGLARSLQEQSWHDLEHRYVSGVEILREMARARGGAAGAVMPVVFTSTLVQENEPGQESLFGWLGEMVHEIAQTPQVWVDAALMEVAGGVKLSWHAVRQLFPVGVLDEMFAAFAALVASLAADQQAWTRERPVPLPAAQQALVAAANDTAGPVPDGLLVDGLLGWARREPDRPAVLAADRALSYGELVGHASRLGRTLRDGGVRPGELVAVAAAKSAEQVVAAVAVQLAGGAYLPVDPDLPVERQDHLVAVGGCRWVLTRAGEPERAWPDAVSVLPVDLAAEPAEPLVPVQGPDDLAYVIFTSGSTGAPKGVVLTHRAALNTLDDVSERFGVGPDDAVLGLSSLSFDLSVYDVFGVLGAGGRLVLPPPGSGRDPDRWAALVAEHGITVWNSVPALAQMLVDAEAARPEPTGALAGLRVALLSGDWIPVTLPDRLRALAPGCAVVSLGGATEAAVWSIAHPVGEVDPDRDSIPYGRPLRNQTFHVLDDRWQECPVWTAGELFIGGVGLALGYWRDEERTAAAFVTSPVTGERLYRTGDLGRWLPDGTIEFLGREDFQVKVGGFRIELGEIESALAGCPGVDAVVVAAPGDRHHRRLVGYLVPAAGADPERLVADARAVAERTLPAYMVPGAFVTLPRLPLSANGKVDRGALPDPAQERDPAGVPAAAAGPTAAALAEVVGEVLGVAEVGLHDNFFAIGGDSISGIQVVGRANAIGLDLTPADLFRHQTIAELAGAVDARRPPAAGPDAGLPRTPYQAFTGPAPGVHGVELPVPDGVCADGVDAAVRAVLARHPALRARLVPGPAGGGGPAGAGQEIAPLDPAAGAPLVELGVLPAARRPAALAGMVADMAAELDAAAGPTVQATLFDLGDGGRRLALVGCDSVADARSWPLLVADLRAALAVAAGGDAPRLPPEVTPYPVWAGRLDPTPGTGGEPAAGADPAPARPDAPAGAALTVPVDLAGAAGLLAEAAAAYRLTAEETGLAVLAAALRGRDDRPALAVEADLRADAVPGLDATGTVGPLAAVLPVRLGSWPAGLGELVPAVKEARRSAAPGPVRPGVLLRHAGDLAAGTPGGPAAPLPSPHLLAAGGPGLTVTTGSAGGDLVAQVSGADGAAVEALAGALAAAAAELAEHCRHPDSGGISASDFPLAGLDTDAMGAFLAAVTRQ